MHGKLRAALLLGFLLLCAQTGYPCLCMPRDARKKLRESEAVFIGEVVAVSKDLKNGTMAIKFKVERYWKGITDQDVIVISSLPGPGSCGLPVDVGEKVLVYASRKKQLETSICSSRRIDLASDELKKLGKGKMFRTG